MLNQVSNSPQTDLAPATFLAHLATRTYSECPTFSQMGIAQLANGTESAQAQAWLSETEKLPFTRYAFAKRRREWLSGRICAKQAAMQYIARHTTTPLDAHDLAIGSGQDGRPYLISHHSAIVCGDIDISISHSHDFAVAIAAKNYCGIDLQYLNNTLFKVKNRFCSDFESLILDGFPGAERRLLGLLWVAKEAVRKCLSNSRLVGFRELELIRMSVENDIYTLWFSPALAGIRLSNISSIEVVAHTVGPYALGLCSIDKEKIHA